MSRLSIVQLENRRTALLQRSAEERQALVGQLARKAQRADAIDDVLYRVGRALASPLGVAGIVIAAAALGRSGRILGAGAASARLIMGLRRLSRELPSPDF